MHVSVTYGISFKFHSVTMKYGMWLLHIDSQNVLQLIEPLPQLYNNIIITKNMMNMIFVLFS